MCSLIVREQVEDTEQFERQFLLQTSISDNFSEEKMR